MRDAEALPVDAMAMRMAVLSQFLIIDSELFKIFLSRDEDDSKRRKLTELYIVWIEGEISRFPCWLGRFYIFQITSKTLPSRVPQEGNPILHDHYHKQVLRDGASMEGVRQADGKTTDLET
jgi:hypothetical protein